ncbi:MAG: hypothetical protein COV09_00780 [Candidatus Vogelbacteria bacterium CG10_big_fil_rev_8_21_14_0_10_50_13]|uniref:DUF2268 domain-containing protein n=1 Tax=Candidatus Vogelbacteria bacterium CG10_big_fil_rev_8_21_14_0_10_50_13 TaxID=1975044 RepID=A0A2H0RIF7_9BACT|nr:MAG: hypothetical protein COV09_00780 [Candidatus Vogelbacteria bacterium CG10_big_fil_rev_8_21_14_0_10_50_13]
MPTIILDTSELLEELLKPFADKQKIPIIPFVEVNRRLNNYKELWEKEGHLLLESLCNKLGVFYDEKTISVWVSGSIVGGYSAPIIVSSNKDMESVIDLITHELIHRLAYRNKNNWSYEDNLRSIVDDKERIVFNHVYVYALHQYLLTETIKDPKRLTREKKIAMNNPANKAAWELVEEIGYPKIIEKIANK